MISDIIKFAGDTKIVQPVGINHVSEMLQGTVNQLLKWSHKRSMQFDIGKFWIPIIKKNRPLILKVMLNRASLAAKRTQMCLLV